MPVRNSWETGNKTYSVDSNISSIQHEIASILYISGLDGSSIDAYEIDDMIAALRQSFTVTKNSIEVDSVIAAIKPAYEFFMRKNSSKLSLVLRRNMRWLKLARRVKEQNNG
jgi:hypothetical protein